MKSLQKSKQNLNTISFFLLLSSRLFAFILLPENPTPKHFWVFFTLKFLFLHMIDKIWLTNYQMFFSPNRHEPSTSLCYYISNNYINKKQIYRSSYRKPFKSFSIYGLWFLGAKTPLQIARVSLYVCMSVCMSQKSI